MWPLAECPHYDQPGCQNGNHRVSTPIQGAALELLHVRWRAVHVNLRRCPLYQYKFSILILFQISAPFAIRIIQNHSSTSFCLIPINYHFTHTYRSWTDEKSQCIVMFLFPIFHGIFLAGNDFLLKLKFQHFQPCIIFQSISVVSMG